MATSKNTRTVTTTADLADIFVLTVPDARFNNIGDLSTSGREASPIVIEADHVTFRNFGTLKTSGENSPVILAGNPEDPVDGVEIYNHGTLEGTRVEGVSIGISLFSFGTGDANLVVNFGEIRMSTDIRAQGIVVFDDNSTVINRGTISAVSEIADGILLVGSGNYGANYGTITVRGEAADGVQLVGADQTFVNWGTIEATYFDTAGVHLQGFEIGQEAPAGTLINFGTISGEEDSVSGAASSETVINRGSLIGNVRLFSGDDIYVAGKGGTLAGTLSLGPGDDLIVLEKGSGLISVDDFSTGTGTEDVIELRGLGIESFEEILSHATESAGTVTLDFGKSTVILANVTIDSLSPDDFIFDGQQVIFSYGTASADYAVGNLHLF